MGSEEGHLRACLRRYYSDMDIIKAKRLLIKYGGEGGKPTRKSRKFVQKINYAKGYEFIRN